MTNDVDEAAGWLVPLNGYLYDVTTDKEVLSVCSKSHTEGYSYIADLVSYCDSLCQEMDTCPRSVPCSDITLPTSSSQYISQNATFGDESNAQQSQINESHLAYQIKSLEEGQFITKYTDDCPISDKRNRFLGMQPDNETFTQDWEKNQVCNEQISEENLLLEIASSLQWKSPQNNAKANTSTRSLIPNLNNLPLRLFGENQATSPASYTGQPVTSVIGGVDGPLGDTGIERSHRQTELVHLYALASGATFSGGNVVIRSSVEDQNIQDKWNSESSEEILPGVNDNSNNTSDFDLMDMCFDNLYNTDFQFSSKLNTDVSDLELSSTTLSGQVSRSEEMNVSTQSELSADASPPMLTDLSSGYIPCLDMLGSTNVTLEQPESVHHNTRCTFSTLTHPVCSVNMANDSYNAFGNLPDTILDSTATSTDSCHFGSDRASRHNLSADFTSDSTQPVNDNDGASDEDSVAHTAKSDSDIDPHVYDTYPNSSHQHDPPSGVDLGRASYQTPHIVNNLHPGTYTSNTQPGHWPCHKSSQRQIRLIEFTIGLLNDARYNPSHVAWVDRDQGMFQIVQTVMVAKLWGRQKNNDGMNYEKLSRAFRYYYKRDVIKQVPGRRLVYQFGSQAPDWRH